MMEDTSLAPSSVMLKTANGLREIASTCLVGSFLYYIYTLLDQYDWGQPFAKLICFSACFAMFVALHRSKNAQPSASKFYHGLEFLLAVAALVWIIAVMAPRYLTHLENGPRVDIGSTTQNSAILLFRNGEDPYASQIINAKRGLTPEHRGFPYGPGMLLGYALSSIAPGIGYNITSLVYLLATLVTLVLLIDDVRPSGTDVWQRLSGGFIVAGLLLLPERLWYELFRQGANDIFPIMLLLIGLLLVQKKLWFWAGVAMGFSFATKFSPAAFLLVLFLRRDIRPRFLRGCCIGLIPLAAFMLWDYKGVMNNVFMVHFEIRYDSTSLYSITPQALHYLFPAAQLAAILVLLKKNFNRALDFDLLVLHFTLLLIIIEVTYKEIHGNHQIWFFPLFAYLATRYRHQLVPSSLQLSYSIQH
ncbi:MAG: glycosyltransferase 87 family protein [Candidatus Binatia bacterium]